MDAPRSIPIHQSLHRPELVLGGERTPVMLCSLLSFMTGVVGLVSFSWLVVTLTIFFWLFVVWMFRRMAKADPIMTKVWARHVGYGHFYPARTSVWSKGNWRGK